MKTEIPNVSESYPVEVPDWRIEWSSTRADLLFSNRKRQI